MAYLIKEDRILRGARAGSASPMRNAVGWRYADTNWAVAAFVMSPPLVTPDTILDGIGG